MPLSAALPALLGGLGWAAWAATTSPGIPGMLLALGALVIVPLGVSPRRGWIALPCAALLVAGLMQPRTTAPAVMFSLPWLAVTVALSADGLRRILRRGAQEPSELCVDTGHVLLLVGGVWAVLDRMGARPLGYDPLLVQLTAVHFHFAGFALPVLAGMAGRLRPGGTPRWIAWGLLAGIPLVAGGLVVSQVTGWTGAEWLPSWLLAGVGVGVALLQLTELRRHPPLRAGLLLLSSAALMVGMFMAGAWGLGRAWGLSWPGMAEMFRFHGLLNALGFSLLGLIARHGTTAAPPLPDPPLQHLRGSGRIGRGWFLRSRLADPDTPPPPGQLDRIVDLAHPGFDPTAVHDDVRHFYEHTDAYELLVQPHWQPLVAPLARVAVALCGTIEQLVLPLPTGDWQRVGVDMLAAAPHNGPADLRLYERHYDDGRAMFIAAYCTVRQGERGWLAVALPLPWSVIVSVMVMDNAPDGGIFLRTRPRPGGDLAGFYLSTPLLTVRLPGHEDLHVFPTPDGLRARHRVTVFGLPVMKMDYRLPRIRT